MTEQGIRLGEILVGRGLVSEADLDVALKRQEVAGGRLATNLVALGLLAPSDLAILLRHQREVVAAVPGAERALAKFEAGFGADHPSTLRARYNLSRLLFLAGRLGEALRLAQDALIDLRRNLGRDHPWTKEAAAMVADAFTARAKAAAPATVTLD